VAGLVGVADRAGVVGAGEGVGRVLAGDDDGQVDAVRAPQRPAIN